METKFKEMDLISTLEAGADGLVEVISQLKILAATARKNIADAVEASQKAQQMQKDLTDKLVAVKLREDATVSKEKKILTAEEIAKAKDDLEAGWVDLANKTKAFERDCSEKRAVLEQLLSDVVVERKALNDRMAALEKERADYKFKILEEFAKTAGKK